VDTAKEQPSSLIQSLQRSISQFERIASTHSHNGLGSEITELFRQGAYHLGVILRDEQRMTQAERTIFDRWDVLACASTHTWHVGIANGTEYLVGANGEFFFREHDAKKRGEKFQELNCERLIASSYARHRENLLELYRKRVPFPNN
jgi:hypothetical protein